MIEHLLTVPTAVYRRSYLPDGYGGRTATRVLVHSIMARFSQPSAQEMAEAGSFQAELSHIVYAKPDDDVLRGDWLTNADGETFRVMATVRPSLPIYLKLFCVFEQKEPAQAES